MTVNNDQVELRSFEDADAMGTAIDKGDIDVMTRTMTPAQIKKLDAVSDGDVDLVDMPGLEIRYLAFDTEAPSVKSKAVRQAMAQVVNRGELVSKVYGTQAEPLYSLVPATITGHSNSFFNKYGNPSAAKAKSLLAKAGITTPVKLTLHYTTDHYGSATKQEFEILQRQLNNSGLFDVSIKGHPWDTFRPAEKKGEYDVYGMGWFPDFPDADNFLAPFLDKDNFLGSPYSNGMVQRDLIPESRREADRLGASNTLTDIQDIVADDVPVLPLWQGKQYVAARTDVKGVAMPQLLLEPPAVGAQPRCERLTSLLRPGPGTARPGHPGPGRWPRDDEPTTRHKQVNMRNQWPVLPVVVGLASGLLTGCGSETGDSGGTGSAVVMGMSDDVLATDPASGYDPGSWVLFNNVFQSLLSFPKGAAEPEPELAEQCTFTDTRAMVYKCRLKDGLKFSNGDDLTSEDVKFSFDRTMKIDDPAGPAIMFPMLGRVETPDAGRSSSTSRSRTPPSPAR